MKKITEFTKEELLSLGCKEWKKPDSEEVRYYLNQNEITKLLENFDLRIEMGLSRAKYYTYLNQKFWFVFMPRAKRFNFKSSLPYGNTDLKYIIEAFNIYLNELLNKIQTQ